MELGLGLGLHPKEEEVGGSSEPVLAFHAVANQTGVLVGAGGITEARTSTIYAPDSAGTFRQFTSGKPAYADGTYTDEDTVSGDVSLYFSPAKTNALLQNRDFTTTWTAINVPAVASNVVGIDGTANAGQTITDDGSAREGYSQSVSKSGDVDKHVYRVFIYKDGSTAEFPAVVCELTGGSSKLVDVQANKVTGAVSVVTTSGGPTYAYVIDEYENYWDFILEMTSVAGNSAAKLTVYGAAGTVLGTTDGMATGSSAFDACEIVLNSSIAKVRGSTPVITTTAPVAVNACDLSVLIANHDDTGPAAWFAEIAFFSDAVDFGINQTIFSNGTASGQYLMYVTTAGRTGSDDGPVPASTLDGSRTAGAFSWNAVVYDAAATRSMKTENGTWRDGLSYDGGFGMTKVAIGSTNAALTSVPFKIKSISRYSGASIADLKSTVDLL